MLGFFRKYQKIFFILITIVIVISFSFFGTYQTMTTPKEKPSEEAFVAVDGKSISVHELRTMAGFLSTETDDRDSSGQLWKYNFLNDGVIRKEFFQTGLAELLAEKYMNFLAKEIAVRETQEAAYTPYVHPQVAFLSSEMAWKFFAPALKEHFNSLKAYEGKSFADRFRTRVQLYLEEKKFPPEFLRQMLRYQENQYGWITPDPNLRQQDMALFGYHSIEDWFGAGFVDLICEFIINSAALASQAGYEVSEEEAAIDLLKNSEAAFHKDKAALQGFVGSGRDYLQQQLLRMGIDEETAVRIWQQVMLFRRYFSDVGGGVFESPLAYKAFEAYAGETADLSVYELSETFRFSDVRALALFEIYLGAVADNAEKKRALIDLPEAFFPVEKVEEQHPQLVQKRYKITVAEVRMADLESKVGVKQTWDWELQDDSWELLKRQFMPLDDPSILTTEQRYSALQKLDDKVRARVDAYARARIVEAHPEWISAALKDSPEKSFDISILGEGGKLPLAGISNPQALASLLDAAHNEDHAALEKLQRYTQDGQTVYRIALVEAAPQKEIITFKNALEQQVLQPLLEKRLKDYYEQVRVQHPEVYQEAGRPGVWHPYKDVEKKLTEQLFSPVIAAIEEGMRKEPQFVQAQLAEAELSDWAAAHRFYFYVAKERLKAMQDTFMPVQDQDTLAAQWQLNVKEEQRMRSMQEAQDNLANPFSMSAKEWSPIEDAGSGKISFFRLLRRTPGQGDIQEPLLKGQQLLADEVKRLLLLDLLEKMEEKHAIKLM